MKRRNLLSALGALAAGGAVATGTGAFTATTADRQFSVSVAGDSNAFLGLSPTSGPNGAYADGADDGELELDFTEDNENIGSGIAGGNGINSNSITHFDDVFEVQNQGTQEVIVSVTRSASSKPTTATRCSSCWCHRFGHSTSGISRK